MVAPSVRGAKRPVKRIIIRPQPGPQERFLGSPADITGYGGAAVGGKTWGILAEPLRHMKNADFGAVIFRRSMPEIMNEGGLWDEARRMYAPLKATPRLQSHEWIFPSGMSVRFAHLQYDDTVSDWQGSQIPLIEFDELTHFTEYQFFYMLSRLRSMSGVRGYVRCTFNPDAGSWVKKFFAPWVDRRYPDPAKSGEIRHFIRVGGVVTWFKTFVEALETLKGIDPTATVSDVKSATFIASQVTDNPRMLERNPGYIGWLKSLPPVEQARLLHGDWDVMPSGGKMFERAWFESVASAPSKRLAIMDSLGNIVQPASRIDYVRFWDFAATEKKLKDKKSKGRQPDYTVGLKMARAGNYYFVVDIIRVQWSPAKVDDLVVQTAIDDGRDVPVRWEEEGGASGKRDTYHLATLLNGFDAIGVPPQGDKAIRARAVSSQARAGNVKLVRGFWNEDFLTELHHFPDWDHDDQVDALSGAYTYLTEEAGEAAYSESPYDV